MADKMASEISYPRQPLPKPEKRGPKPKKHIKQSGKVAQTWAKVKAQYLKDNPPDYRGYRTCGICGGLVHESEVDVDHLINRSLRPDLRYEPSNLQACHYACNSNKKVGGVGEVLESNRKRD